MHPETKTINADIIKYLNGLYGGIHGDEGLLYGTPDAGVKKIQVCWMADVAAIKNAADNDADLIIAHEALVFPYPVLNDGGVINFMSWRVNHRRLNLLARSGISLIRAHGTLDKLCVYDDFASMLGLSDPVVDSKHDYAKVFDIENATYGDMIARVKKAAGMKTVRATNGDRARVVKRIGLPWGGLGLFVNAGYMQRLVEMGCDLFIAGETDNYGLRFAVDAGLDMIETGHEISENPGLRNFTKILAREFPDLEIYFYENAPLWENV